MRRCTRQSAQQRAPGRCSGPLWSLKRKTSSLLASTACETLPRCCFTQPKSKLNPLQSNFGTLRGSTAGSSINSFPPRDIQPLVILFTPSGRCLNMQTTKPCPTTGLGPTMAPTTTSSALGKGFCVTAIAFPRLPQRARRNLVASAQERNTTDPIARALSGDVVSPQTSNSRTFSSLPN